MFLTLLRIGDDTRRNSLCAPIRSSLAVVGPMAQQLKQTRRPELQRELDELSQVAKETEKLVNGEHTTGRGPWKALKGI